MTNSNKTSAAVAFADNMGDDEHEEGENVQKGLRRLYEEIFVGRLPSLLDL